MTTREKLLLMDDIRHKNDASWGKYAQTPRRYWTWEADVKRPFRPFAGFGAQCVLALCVPLLLVLFLMMAA